jgi:hypothetical protein
MKEEYILSLDGDNFDPDDLTEYLGIEPTSTKRKGERIQNLLPKTSSWQLSTDNIVNNVIDVFEMSSSIVKKLLPKKELIIKAKAHFGVSPRLEVVLFISTNELHSTPAIGFDADVVAFLGEIGAYIDIDTYKH